MYTTEQLELHIRAIAEKGRLRAEQYGVEYDRLVFTFDRFTPEKYGYYRHIYEEDGVYHYRDGDRGKESVIHLMTDLLEEITYYALFGYFMGMSVRYARLNEVRYPGGLYRRVCYSLFLELFGLAGKKVRQIAEADIRDRMERYPLYADQGNDCWFPAEAYRLREPKTMGHICHSAGWQLGKTFVRFPEQKTVEILSDGKVIGEYHAGHRDSRGMTIRAHYHLAEQPEHRYEVIEE